MLVLLSVLRSPLHKSSSFECLLMVFAITMIICCMGRGSVDERGQRLALEALYDATGGSLWYEGCRCNSYGCWLQEDLPHCNWTRVGCASDGITVATLDLLNCNLSGELPPDLLLRLSQLEGLDCSNNSLTGAVPLLRSSSLQQLYLQYNRLTGPFPTLDFVSSSLGALSLSGNSLNGSLPALTEWLPGLYALQLANNSFEGEIPAHLCDSCSIVDLSWNCFNGSFPSTICTPALTQLYLSYNFLSGGLPSGEDIARCISLKVLAASDNSFSGSLPPEMQGLGNLTYLSLARNDLSGSFDDLMGKLPHALCFCDVSHNNLTGSIDSLWNAYSPPLTYLSVAGNREMRASSSPYPQMVPAGHEVYDGEYRCVSFGVVTMPLELVISPSYFDYKYCECASGYFGKPPGCSFCQPLHYATNCSGDSMTYRTNYYPDLCASSSSATGELPSFMACASSLSGDPLCNVNGKCRLVYDEAERGYVLSRDCEPCRKGYSDRLCSRCVCTEKDDRTCYFERLGECIECSAPPSWALAIAGTLLGLSLLAFLLAKGTSVFVVLTQGTIALLLFGISLLWDIPSVLVLLFLQGLILWTRWSSSSSKSTSKEEDKTSWHRCSFEGLAKILLFFLQTAHLVTNNWPASISRVPYLFDFVNLSVDLRCFSWFRAYFVVEWKAFLVGMLVPIFLSLLYSLLLIAQTFYREFVAAHCACRNARDHQVVISEEEEAEEETPALRVVQEDGDDDDEQEITTTTYESMEKREEGADTVETENPSGWKDTLGHESVHGSLLVLYVAYPLLAKKILSVFSCHSSSRCSGESYMDSKPWLPCDRSDPEYGALWLEAIVFACFYLVGVLALFSGLLLVWGRDRDHLFHPRTQRWLGFLYLSYRPTLYWYEILWLLRKLCISAALAVLSEGSAIFAIVLVLLFSIVAQTRLEPFRYPVENKLETCSLGMLVLIVVARDSPSLAWFSACGTIACASVLLGSFVLLRMAPASFSRIVLVEWRRTMAAAKGCITK